MNFKEWLELTEGCGTMGCPGHAYKTDDTPQGRAAKRYPKYKLDNKGCSGTLGPCDPPGGAGAAPAVAPPSKMQKK